MRQSHLEGLAEALAKKNGTTAEAELKKLTHVSKQRKQARRLTRARKLPPKGLAIKLVENTPQGESVLEEQNELVKVSA